MITFVFIASLLGCLVLAVISTFILTILVYVIACVTVFAAIKVPLIEKRIYEIFDNEPKEFKERCNHTNKYACQRRPTQYIKYFIYNYFRFVWRHDKIGKAIIEGFTESVRKCRYNNCHNSTFPIPLKRNLTMVWRMFPILALYRGNKERSTKNERTRGGVVSKVE